MKSLALFSFHLLNYARYIRVADEESCQLNWISAGSLLYFLWRLFMLASRILALALFASYFTRLVFVVVGLHFVACYIMLCRQECEYFEEEPMKQRFFRCAISYVHVFCFFPLEGKNTRKWGIPYYLLTFLENGVMVLLWNFVAEYNRTFRTIAISTESATFFIGLLALLSFYCCFHPSHRNDNAKLDDLDSGCGAQPRPFKSMRRTIVVREIKDKLSLSSSIHFLTNV